MANMTVKEVAYIFDCVEATYYETQMLNGYKLQTQNCICTSTWMLIFSDVRFLDHCMR